MEKMDFETFKREVKALDVVYSVGRERIKYNCSVNNEETIVTVVRESTGNSGDINISRLYEFYMKENCYKTTIAEKYVPRYMRSPAVAILCALTEEQN